MFPATARRLSAEWSLLQRMVQLNPTRIQAARADDNAFQFTLHGPAALSIPSRDTGTALFVHDVRVEFPVHFPAVPMEMYLRTPVFHPNVHPETGFVCLWDRHRVSNTIELGLHKLVAMLAGTLYNAEAPNVMQREALPCIPGEPMPLVGIAYDPPPLASDRAGARRRRLS